MKTIASMLLVCLVLITTGVSAGTVKVGGLDWYDSLAEGKAAATVSGKPIYIYFTGGSGCGWCVKMKGETFSNEDVKKNVLGRVVLVMLNVWVNTNSAALTRDKSLFREYGGRGVPFNVLLDSKGEKISTFSGFMPPVKFSGKMSTILDTYGKYRKTAVAAGTGASYPVLLAHLRNCDALEKKEEAGKLAVRLRTMDSTNSRGDGAYLELSIARWHEAVKNGTLAMKHYRQAIALDADNGRKIAEKAVYEALYLLYMEKKFGEIIVMGKQGLALPGIGKQSKAWYNLLTGFGFKETGKKTEAVASFKVVQQLLPATSWARIASYWINKLNQQQ